jgi:hypothetical protein
MRKWNADLGAVTRFLAPVMRLTGALNASLNPKTETEARIVDRQLDRHE